MFRRLVDRFYSYYVRSLWFRVWQMEEFAREFLKYTTGEGDIDYEIAQLQNTARMLLKQEMTK